MSGLVEGVVIVSGGSRGLGLDVARVFLESVGG